MKPVAAAVMLALVPMMFAPAAHAQATCADVTTLNRAAFEEFDSISGAAIDDDVYSATLKLPNASACVVEAEFEVIYCCVWSFASRENAVQAYVAQSSAIAPCLAGWTASTLPSDKQVRPGVMLISGAVYVGEDDFEYMEWNVTLQEYGSAQPAPYRLWVEMILY